MKRIFSITIFILLFISICKSQDLELSLSQAFERASQLDLPLLVVRFDQGLVDYPKRFKSSTEDSILDSIMNIPENKDILEAEFVIYKLNALGKKDEDMKFQEQLILDYTPNFILYSSGGDLIHFYKPIDSESDPNSIIESLRDTLAEKTILLQKRLLLESKLANKEIESEELYELIKIKHSIHMTTREEINEYVRMGNAIDFDLMYIVNKQTFRMSDPITKYLIEMDDQDPMYHDDNQHHFFLNMSQSAEKNKDVSEFEEAFKWKLFYKYKRTSSIFDPSSQNPFVSELMKPDTRNDLFDQFNFYKSVNDETKVIKFGNELANHFLNEYEATKEAVLANHIAREDFIINGTIELNPIDSSTLQMIENRKLYREEGLKKIAKDYDSANAQDLNYIAWTFYEMVNEKSELEKALQWSKTTLDLNLTPGYMDTYAHLLFKLGNKEKAIAKEQKALELAIEAGNERQIEEFKQAISKFQVAQPDK